MADPLAADEPVAQAGLPSAPIRLRRTVPSWPKRVARVVMALSIALAALGLLAAVSGYLLRDKTASSPAPQTLTVTAPKGSGPASGPDGAFLSALSDAGIGDNGVEGVRQRYIEFGHHICFSLLPPKPQPLDSTVDDILVAQNKDVAGDPWSHRFTRSDAEHLAKAAISAYCPNAPK